MTHFQLFKSRGFGDYITDVFDFFRRQGKHFLGLYTTLCLPVLMGVLLLFYLYYTQNQAFQLKGMQAGDGLSEFKWYSGYSFIAQEYLGQSWLYLGLFVVLFVLFVAFSIFLQAFPIFYFQLYERRDSAFGIRDIWHMWCEKWPRFVGFYLKALVAVVPLLMLVLLANIALMFVIVGIPLLLIVLPSVFVWLYQALLCYVVDRLSFRTSLYMGFRVLKRQFWPLIGAVLVLYLILYILQIIFSGIPMAIGIFEMFSARQGSIPTEMPWTMTLGVLISTLVGLLGNNLLLAQQSLMYYSYRETTENHSSYDAIDQIGQE